MMNRKEIKTNALILGVILFLVCALADAVVIGAVALAVAIGLFVLRNGLLSR